MKMLPIRINCMNNDEILMNRKHCSVNVLDIPDQNIYSIFCRYVINNFYVIKPNVAILPLKLLLKFGCLSIYKL